MIVTPIVPSVPSTPACNLISQPSGGGLIKEIIEPGHEHKLEDLQPSQSPAVGPSEQSQSRRNERICLQHEKISQASQLQDLKPEEILENIPVLYLMKLIRTII